MVELGEGKAGGALEGEKWGHILSIYNLVEHFLESGRFKAEVTGVRGRGGFGGEKPHESG